MNNYREPIFKQGNTGFIANVKIKGNTTPLDGNWTCKILIVGSGIAQRDITEKTEDNLGFKIQVLPTESAQLAIGKHTLAVEIANPTLTTPFVHEFEVSFTIRKQYITS